MFSVFELFSKTSSDCNVCLTSYFIYSAYFTSYLSQLWLGPSLSRCSCIGPRAMAFGQVVDFCQIILALQNCRNGL